MPTDEIRFKQAPPGLPAGVRWSIYLTVGTALLLAGIMIGRFFQDAAHGYHYRLLDKKEYTSDLGPIEWTCFMESEGTPILDTEKTMISMGNRTIYKAQRDFQEDAPSARNIQAQRNLITWDDGDYLYRLTVDKITDADPGWSKNRSTNFNTGTP